MERIVIVQCPADIEANESSLFLIATPLTEAEVEWYVGFLFHENLIIG